VRGGEWFLEEPYLEHRERFGSWVRGVGDRRLLCLEIDSGFNTLVVIRWPMGRITYAFPQAHLVRVVPLHSMVPEEIAERSVSLDCGAGEVIAALSEVRAVS
jgi:hypothetical protein